MGALNFNARFVLQIPSYKKVTYHGLHNLWSRSSGNVHGLRRTIVYTLSKNGRVTVLHDRKAAETMS